MKFVEAVVLGEDSDEVGFLFSPSCLSSPEGRILCLFTLSFPVLLLFSAWLSSIYLIHLPLMVDGMVLDYIHSLFLFSPCLDLINPLGAVVAMWSGLFHSGCTISCYHIVCGVILLKLCSSISMLLVLHGKVKTHFRWLVHKTISNNS